MVQVFKSLCLCALLCACLAVPSLAAASNTLAGWEDWDTADYGGHVVMTCKEKNLKADDILAYVSKLISENQGTIGRDYQQFQMRFFYTRQMNSFSGVVNFMAQDVIPAVGGLWPCPNTFADVSVSVGKTNSEYYLHLTVDMNGGSDEVAMLYHKIKEVGDEARTASSSTAEQLGYINAWLTANTTYLNSGSPSENDAYGAVIEGQAVCGGYAEAITLFCRYLGVPCTTIRNTVHIWNRVLVDDEWKQLDATWSDSAGAKDYFLVSFINETTSHSFDSDVLTQNQITARERTALYTAPATLYNAALALNEKGILLGDNQGFSLSSPLTRAQLAIILTRLYYPEAEHRSPTGVYTDAPQWAAAGIEWCVGEGYLLPVNATYFGAESVVMWSELASLLSIDSSSKDGIALRADAVLAALNCC